MNKLRLLTILFATLFLTTLASCSKDDDAEPSKTTLLTSKTWVANQVLVDSINRTNEFDFDIQSIKYTFEERGVYLYTYNGSVSNGTWEFTDNETKILFDKGTSYEASSDLVKLSSTSLTLSSKVTNPANGITFIYEIRYLNE